MEYPFIRGKKLLLWRRANHSDTGQGQADIYDDSFTTHTVLPSFLLPYHVIGAHEIMAVINDDASPEGDDEKITVPETDEAASAVSSSLAYRIRKTMDALASQAYLAICRALSRGRKVFTLTT